MNLGRTSTGPLSYCYRLPLCLMGKGSKEQSHHPKDLQATWRFHPHFKTKTIILQLDHVVKFPHQWCELWCQDGKDLRCWLGSGKVKKIVILVMTVSGRGSIPIYKRFLPTVNTSIPHHAVNLSARNICWYYRLYNYHVFTQVSHSHFSWLTIEIRFSYFHFLPLRQLQ